MSAYVYPHSLMLVPIHPRYGMLGHTTPNGPRGTHVMVEDAAAVASNAVSRKYARRCTMPVMGKLQELD